MIVSELRHFEVTLAHGDELVTYDVAVDVDLAVRARALAQARVRASVHHTTPLPPNAFHVWTIKEQPDESAS